jgi:hypothetical protein
MWLLISGPTNYGVYQLPAPLPTGNTTSLTISQKVPPTTASPGSVSFGGVAFNVNGEMFVSSNSGSNQLYKMQNNYALTLVSTMTVDGVGTDLTSCNYPLFLLSVNWINFNISVKNENVTLTWTVAEKADNAGFEIQQSTDGKKWEKIGFLQSKGVESIHQQYSFVHNNLLTGKHYYRIVGIDKDDRKLYSESRMITTNKGARMSVWPNPAQDILKVEMSTEKDYTTAKMIIYDQAGRQVTGIELHKGVNNINIRSLALGNYFVRIDFADGQTLNQRFMKHAL